MDLKMITRVSILIALSVVINILESYIPFFNNIIPGLKLGFANIIIIYTLYKYDSKTAIYVSLIRVLLVGLLRTGLFSITFFFSLAGAILSILVMIIAKKIKILSIIGVSIIGSVFHSLGQIIIGIILLNNKNIIYYLPYLLLFSIPTGIFIGVISKKILEYPKNI